MVRPFDKWMNLHAEGEQLRLDFLRTELETCRVFAALAATELEIGDRVAVWHCTTESIKAYQTVFRFLPTVAGDEEKGELEMRLKELREALDDLLNRLGR